MGEDQDYFELLRAWITDEILMERDEYGFHPCAPHETMSLKTGCFKRCACGHACKEHVFLNGQNMYGPKPTAYICLEPGCECKMFEDAAKGDT